MSPKNAGESIIYMEYNNEVTIASQQGEIANVVTDVSCIIYLHIVYMSSETMLLFP